MGGKADTAVTVVTRAVAFNRHGGDVHDKAPHPVRPKGVEMKREMTKEDKELADACLDGADSSTTIRLGGADYGCCRDQNYSIHTLGR